jgi:hypothetical protein
VFRLLFLLLILLICLDVFKFDWIQAQFSPHIKASQPVETFI